MNHTKLRYCHQKKNKCKATKMGGRKENFSVNKHLLSLETYTQ